MDGARLGGLGVAPQTNVSTSQSERCSSRPPTEATLLQGFSADLDPEDRLPGVVRNLDLPIRRRLQTFRNTARHIGERSGGFALGRVVVRIFRSDVWMRFAALADSKRIVGHRYRRDLPSAETASLRHSWATLSQASLSKGLIALAAYSFLLPRLACGTSPLRRDQTFQ